MQKQGVLNSNVLKIIGAIFMVIDHAGFFFFEQGTTAWFIVRSMGRIAFPIFAYFIAEGCFYTRHKARYILTVLFFGLICMFGYAFAMKQVYFNVLITFAFSILLIYFYKNVVKNIENKNYSKGAIYSVLFVLLFLFVFILEFVFCPIIAKWTNTDCVIDYGALGALVPFCVYIFKNRTLKIAMFTLSLIALSMSATLSSIIIYHTYSFLAFIQWFSLLSVPIMTLYSGERGKYRMKYFFYFFYPIQFLILEGIVILLTLL